MFTSMNTNNTLDDPDHWRKRAAQTRAKADMFAHLQSKVRLLKIAEEYDRLAERAEQQQQQAAQRQDAS